MIELRAIRGETGRLLVEQLRERGVDVTTQRGSGNPIVSYGVHVPVGTVPVLNANAGRLDKFRELQRLRSANVSVPDFTQDVNMARTMLPILGRELRHMRGRNINLFRERVGTAQFYTKYIPKNEEYRVWTYRGTPLALYQKVRRYPNRRRRLPLVWNWENGYAFDFIHPDNRTGLQTELLAIGVNAVRALDLDFGAADIIIGRDQRVYVLEVNTAPGVEGPRHGLTSLADKITRWASNGCPRRRGDDAMPRGVR